MLTRLGRRALLAVLTILLATALLYVGIRLVPGSPWADDPSTPESLVREWARRHHLDRGFAQGYLLWLRAVLEADLGSSYVVASGERVADLIARAAPTSILLGTLGFGTALLLSVALGLAAAGRPGGAWDRATSVLLYILHAAPTFWIAMLLQELFALRLGWLPPFGSGPVDPSGAGGPEWILERIPYWVLPPACLALGSMAFLFRFTRASLLEAIRGAHVRAARARGIPESLLLGRHAFAGTRIHLVTLLGLLVPGIIGGSVIIETIFALPGLGRLLFLAVGARDYPVIMGVGLVMAVASVIASALADMVYLLVEPRLRGPGVAKA